MGSGKSGGLASAKVMIGTTREQGSLAHARLSTYYSLKRDDWVEYEFLCPMRAVI